MFFIAMCKYKLVVCHGVSPRYFPGSRPDHPAIPSPVHTKHPNGLWHQLCGHSMTFPTKSWFLEMGMGLPKSTLFLIAIHSENPWYNTVTNQFDGLLMD